MRLRDILVLQRHLYFLVHLKGLLTGGFGKRHYGQWAEDTVIDSLLSGKKKGLYIDVGAYHPFHYSNTYLLYRRGWSGINIDPNPDSIRLFNIHRRRDVNLAMGIAAAAGARKYYIFNHQSCNTFSDTQRDEMLRKSFIRQIGEADILCAPLSDVIRAHANGRPVDLLNIDAEGMSMEVLRSIDWDMTQPSVICIEDDDFDFSAENYGSDIYTYLRERSYELHARIGLSCIYKKRVASI